MDSQISTELRNNRQRALTEAGHARLGGRDRKAIALYKKVLLEDPRNVEAALKVAPLLARRGEAFDAWQLYRMASQELLRDRRREECLDALREACRWVPHEFDAWRLRAELEIKLGREDRAYETLLEGRQHFKRPDTRAQAIALLIRAREIVPFDSTLILDLALLHAKSDQAEAALELLDALLESAEPHELRQIFGLQFRITLAPRYAARWFGALLAPRSARRRIAKEAEVEDVEPEPEPLRAEVVPAAADEIQLAEPTMPLVQWEEDDTDVRSVTS